MQLFRNLFSRRWWWVTIIVILLMALLARLGVWQLDRLEQRRAANRELAAMLASPPVEISGTDFPQDVASWENRQVRASGTYDHGRQVLLKVQNWEGRAGVHLITPLVFEDGDTAVLIDRGWIPDAQRSPGAQAAYNDPGSISVEGYLAPSQELSRAAAAMPEGPQSEWYRVDIAAIQGQMPYTLLPFYVIQAPGTNEELPYRLAPENDLSEGSHLSYAVQWFIFSIGLGIAYLAFVNKNTRQPAQ